MLRGTDVLELDGMHPVDLILPQAKIIFPNGPEHIPMLYNHEGNPHERDIPDGFPIGIWTDLRVDAGGLWLRGEVFRDAEKSSHLIPLIERKAITGLSIGFKSINQIILPNGDRNLLEILVVEVSLVAFPMQQDARFKVVS